MLVGMICYPRFPQTRYLQQYRVGVMLNFFGCPIELVAYAINSNHTIYVLSTLFEIKIDKKSTKNLQVLIKYLPLQSQTR